MLFLPRGRSDGRACIPGEYVLCGTTAPPAGLPETLNNGLCEVMTVVFFISKFDYAGAALALHASSNALAARLTPRCLINARRAPIATASASS